MNKMNEEEEDSLTAFNARKKSRRRMRIRFNRLIRRVHLYFGLVLVPWILLYGITAVLFNHSSWFTERESMQLAQAELVELESAKNVAERALEESQIEDVEIVPESARWVGYLSLRGENQTDDISVRIHPEGKGGAIRTRPKSKDEAEWTEPLQKWKPFDEAQEAKLVAQAMNALEPADLDFTNLKIRSYPTLKFNVVRNGEEHTLEMNLKGEVKVDDKETLRKKLVKLHVTHGDPGHVGSRWLWFLIVDIMGFAMIIWGLTGALMWWTIKPTRKTGGIALTFGFAAMTILALSLWFTMGME